MYKCLVKIYAKEIKILRVTDKELINALLSCSTIKMAAEQIGLSEQSVYNRLRKDEFRKKLKEERVAQAQIINSKLSEVNFKALDTLVEILDNKECSIGIRLKASSVVFDITLKNREQLDILTRIEDIETKLNNV